MAGSIIAAALHWCSSLRCAVLCRYAALCRSTDCYLLIADC
jgi:hypothetical protein